MQAPTHSARLMRRLPAALPCLVALVALTSAAQATTIGVTLTNLNPAQSGTYDYALTQINMLPGDAHDIVFGQALGNNQITLTEAANIPQIDIGVLGSVDLDASGIAGFRIRPESGAPADFRILHIASGTVTLVDLDISGAPFQVDSDGTLGLRYSADHEITNGIVGSGSLIKEGTNVITLSGLNTYSGGTEILAGELRGDMDAIQGDFAIARDALLVASLPGSSSADQFAGDVSGEGRVAKEGEGLLSFTGKLTHTGGTEIRAGRVLTTADSLLGDVRIDEDAQLLLLESGTGTFAGVVSGEGTIFKSGSGDLEFTGANTFEGVLVVQQAQVSGTTASLPSDIELDGATTEVVFRQDVDGTHSRSIYGTGALAKEGTGTVTLAGTSDYSGGTFIYGGRLRGDTASLKGDIDFMNTGTALEFSHADTQVFAGSISGAGDVYKTGSGLLGIASQQAFTGSVEIQAGTLRLDVDQPLSFAQVNVGSAGALSSTASAAIGIMGNLDASGRVSPGVGSVTGTLDIGGTAAFQPGSVLAVSVDENEQSSQLIVAGATTLNGGVVELDVLPGLYATQKFYSVLIGPSISGAGLTGTQPQYAFLDITNPVVVADPLGSGNQVVQVSIQSNATDVSSYATTANQAQTANAVEVLLTSPDPDVTEIWRNLGVLTVDEVPAALDALGGQTLTAFANPRLDGMQQLSTQLSRRFSATQYEHGHTPGRAATPQHIDVAADFEPARRTDGFGAWMDAFGVFDELDGSPNTVDMKTRSYGVTLGLDYRFPQHLPFDGSQHIRVGIAGGYIGHGIESEGETTTGRGNGVQAALYAAWETPRFHVGAALRYAYTAMSTEREIAFGGLARRADAEFAGNEIGALIEVGARFGEPKVASFRPLLNLQFDHVQQNGFEETGAGALNLETGDFAIDSVVSTLGTRVSRLFTLDGKWGIEPEIRAGWTHEFGDRGRHVETRFYSTGGPTFVGAGTEPDRDSAWIGAGYVMRLSEVPLLSTSYDGYFGQNHARHVLTASLLFRW